MENKGKKTKFISITELAKILGISRVAVFKKIQKKQIPAEKIGRAYAIAMEDVNNYVDGSGSKKLTEENKEAIKKAVERVVKEYGETLRLLGKE